MRATKPQAAPRQTEPKVVRWWRDYPLLVFFMAVWVAPMFWMGAAKQRLSHVVASKIQMHVNLQRPVLPVAWQKRILPKNELTNRVEPITWYDVVALPREITHLHNASCLFTEVVTRWQTNHVQGSTDGRRWFTLRDEFYSPMKPFGHRARIDRPLSDIGAYIKRSSVYRDQAEQICNWYRNRYAKLNPDAPPLAAVRLIAISYTVGEPALAEPAGHWIKHLPEDVKDRAPYIIHTKMFAEVPHPPKQHAHTRHVEQAIAATKTSAGDQTQEGTPCCAGL
jgi:hypothetical protein